MQQNSPLSDDMLRNGCESYGNDAMPGIGAPQFARPRSALGFSFFVAGCCALGVIFIYGFIREIRRGSGSKGKL